MENQNNPAVNKTYLVFVVLLMFVLPSSFAIGEFLCAKGHLSLIYLIGKWFTFWSIGVRLFTAGLRQAINPSFTAETIFHLKDKEGLVIVRELGYANICLGSIGMISLFIPGWLLAAAFAGGLFYAIAGINHIVKKPVGANEWIALVSDVFIAVVILSFFISRI